MQRRLHVSEDQNMNEMVHCRWYSYLLSAGFLVCPHVSISYGGFDWLALPRFHWLDSISHSAWSQNAVLQDWDNETYRPLWDLDKTHWTKRFAATKRPLSSFETEILKYRNYQSDIAVSIPDGNSEDCQWVNIDRVESTTTLDKSV